MPDNVLSFETRVNLAGLDDGLDEATASISGFSATAKAAMEAAALATEKLADAQIKLGASAQQGSAKAAEIIAQYQEAVNRTTAAVQQLSSTESTAGLTSAQIRVAQKRQYEEYAAAAKAAAREETEAEQQLTIAQRRQYEEYIQQSRAEAAADKTALSNRMAIGAEMRIATGSTQGATRALGAYLAQFPLIAQAAQAAFTGFAIVAATELVVEFGKKLYDAFDMGGERARKTAEEIRNVSNELERSTTTLDVQIDKLAQEEAKLEKIPFNGAKLVLDEAAEAAQNLADRLEKVAVQERAVVASMAGSGIQRLFGASQTGYEQRMETEHARHLGEQVNIQGELNESVSFYNSLQIRLNDLKDQQKIADEELVASAQSGGTVIRRNYDNEIQAVNEMIAAQQREQKNIQTTIDLDTQQKKTQAARDAHQTGPKGPDLDISRFRVIQEQFAELQELTVRLRGTSLSAGEAAQFWTPFLAEFSDQSRRYRDLINQAAAYDPGTAMSKKLLLEAQKLAGANEAYKSVLNEITRDTSAAHKQLFTEVLGVNPQAARSLVSDAQEYDEVLKAIRRDSDASAKAADDMAKGMKAARDMVRELNLATAEQQHQANQQGVEATHAKASTTIDVQETKVQAGQALGITNPEKDLQLLRNLHQQAIAEDERYLQQQMAELQRTAAQEQALYAGNGKKIEEIQKQTNDQLLELQKKLDADKKKSQQQQVQDTEKVLSQQLQNFKTVYGEMTADFNSAITSMITTTEKPAQAFAQMLNQMLGQLANFILQYLEKKAEMWALDAILGKASATSTAASTILTDAAVAGAGAYAATAAIPVVGPGLAPAAAAAAYAGTLSFLGLAAFEAGGVVSGGTGMPVPIMAHAGERVLSAPQTQNFERMVNGGGGSSHTTHINYNPHVSAFDNSGLKSTLHSHRDTILDIVRQGYKQGSLVR